MLAMQDALSPESITLDLNSRVVGRRVVYYERVGSTNDVAAQLADAGEPEGMVVIADEQTQGRGRMKRAWIAPKTSSVLMSLVLRPAMKNATQIAVVVSLGTCAGITLATGLAPQLKWPNDILLKGKKCAGTLIEAKTLGEQIEYMIVGLGLNVNFRAADVPSIPLDATTLADELGRFVPRVPLAQAILRGIDNYYERLIAGEDLRAEWKLRLANIGQRVRARIESSEEEGIAEDVDADGALLLRRADGTLARLIAQDATLSV